MATLTNRQIELVENSWDFVILNSSEAGELFYGRLFTIAPNLRSLFKGDLNSQSKKLVSMITFIVHKLRKLDDVIKDVKALGQRHKNYKVKPENYDIVAEALLWTLEKALGTDWNDELKTAWTKVYQMLAKLMIEASVS